MDDQPDYPAAHSMDTIWFAVDRDGHVAVFASGEAGAVPVDAYLGEDGEEMADGAFPDGPATEPIFVRDRVEPGRSAHAAAPAPGHATSPSTLVFVDDEAVVAADVAAGLARPVRADVGRAAFYPAMPAEVHERLHASGACRACTWYFGEESSELAARGFFRYEHRTDNWIAGPYGLDALPAEPLRAEQAEPAFLRKTVRYDGCFAETRTLQPVERWTCEAWGAAWLASDMKTVRALPGKERDYAEEVAQLRDVDEGLDVTPPDPAAPASSRKPWWRFW